MKDTRDEDSLRALLGEPAPLPVGEEDAFSVLGKMRPLTAGTYALLHQTLNEWALGFAPEEMANRHFATLAWLYIQAGPLEEVRRVAFDRDRFRDAVLAWGDRLDADGQPLLTVAMLTAATQLITDALAQKAAADFSIQPKPDALKPDPDTPPNS